MKPIQYRILLAVLALLFFTILAGGCASSEPTPTPAVEAPPAAAAPTDDTPATPAPTPTEAVQPGVTFRNPVLRNDFPDPHIIQVDGTYYAYATNSAGRNV
jgi:arabinan endo-1,5-alpha-L-arabinosidase